MERFISGIPASQLFKELREQDSAITGTKLVEILLTEFPKISPAACVAINRWSGIGSVVIPDETLDALISHYIKEAGYGN
ncbi:hypothetical protein [Xanthomonas sp. D-109]|uniref:hypothetical protein n=1 Tax=Xanthomonas sp. D-109 TaxID=2821274 RepID=UPI001ADBFA6E|nr:hypothetical protein [Xanthomonas sp. D-109]MBO9880700.1 hypothetical protein [Xanthomonas sp. D-109]